MGGGGGDIQCVGGGGDAQEANVYGDLKYVGGNRICVGKEYMCRGKNTCIGK